MSLSPWSIAVLNLCIGLSTFACILAIVLNNRQNCSQKALNTYSPLYDRLSITARPTLLYDDPSQTVYNLLCLPPSPEVDAAWTRISTTTTFPMTHPEALKSGKDHSTLWTFPPKNNVSGHEAEYMAFADVFHQLHCLNNLRRASSPGYYGDLNEVFKNHSFPFEDHTLHCQFVLMEVLTCHADLEMKVLGKSGKVGLNRGMRRMCRDFDALVEWRDTHGRVLTVEEMSRTPEGIRELPAKGRAVPG